MQQFKTESRRLLELMINSIYTHREIFLRELISNASDAVDKLAFRALTDPNVGLARTDFYIKIEPDADAGTLTISDNGIGMTLEELEDNLGTIAQSGSLAFKSKFDESPDGKPEDIDVIGQFGVGFYSAFMVADKVEVISRAFGTDSVNTWISSGSDGFEIVSADADSVPGLSHGTIIKLYLKTNTENDDYSEFLDKYSLRQLVKKYSDYIRYPIIMDVEHTHTEEGGVTSKHIEPETVNSMTPIWQRPKSEVSDDDCTAFYRDKYYDSVPPLSVIRVSGEGLVEFKAMLFVPGTAPSNYYSRDFEPGLQLYSSGVMIMDKCADLLPEYFRFIRGIVDTSDLSLNISRELLQHDRQLRVIAQSLTKRIKSELKKLMDEDPDKYKTFWRHFGLQLKYATISEFGMNKNEVSDLLLFNSAHAKSLVSLQQYADAMPEAQKYIYYAFGADASRLPQAEPVLDAGFDVICLSDDTDEFVMQSLGTFAEKAFLSVNSDDLELPDSAAKNEETDKREADNLELLDFVKNALGGEVAAVKLSRKLKTAPVCLSTQGSVTLEMERYFKSLPTSESAAAMKAERVLELNGSHKAFETLKTAFETDKEHATRISKLLYYQSQLLAGIDLSDPSELADLIAQTI